MLKRTFMAAVAAVILPLHPVSAQDLTALSWDKIVEQAKAEGEVTWFQWYFQDRFREEVKAFEELYGIKVTIPDGENAANFNKFLAEANRPQGDIDVLSVSAANVPKFDPVQFSFGPLNNILPGADKLKYVVEGNDSKGYAVAFWGNQTAIAYNPARISDADVPRSVEDFAKFLDEHPKELGFNTEGGAAGLSFMEGVVRSLVPDVDYASGASSPEILDKLTPAWDWFKVRSDKYVITASNVDSVQRLNSGEFMVVPAFEDMISSMQSSGEISKDIKVYVPDFGMPAGGNLVTIPANAKHKAAALVFISWLTSPETQTAFNQRFGSAPQHPDADSSQALISSDDRQKAIIRIPNPLLGDVRAQFIEQVTLN